MEASRGAGGIDGKLDFGLWLAAAVVAGVILFAVYHHAEYRHSPYREGGH